MIRVNWIATKRNWLLITMDEQKVLARLKHRRRDNTWVAQIGGMFFGEFFSENAAAKVVAMGMIGQAEVSPLPRPHHMEATA